MAYIDVTFQTNPCIVLMYIISILNYSLFCFLFFIHAFFSPLCFFFVFSMYSVILVLCRYCSFHEGNISTRVL